MLFSHTNYQSKVDSFSLSSISQWRQMVWHKSVITWGYQKSTRVLRGGSSLKMVCGQGRAVGGHLNEGCYLSASKRERNPAVGSRSRRCGGVSRGEDPRGPSNHADVCRSRADRMGSSYMRREKTVWSSRAGDIICIESVSWSTQRWNII